MYKKIRLHYPMGSGGHWLRAVLEHNQFEQSQYINFHYDSPEHWVFLSHSPDDFDIALSGQYHFNFFCNQIYKHLYHEVNFFSSSDYATIVSRLTAMSVGIKTFSIQIPDPYFDFDQLIHSPAIFLHNIQQLQQANDQSATGLENFQRARTLFLDSCVDVSKYYNNSSSVWWNLYCVGQLICLGTNPEFDIRDTQNFDRLRLFVQQHQSQIQLPPVWINSGGVNLDSIISVLSSIG
jgi:hypothetical protein